MMTARGTKRSLESDAAAVAPPALRDNEPLLFDALVNRADCMLNPLASNRQLMVNDVLHLVRRRLREPLLCLYNLSRSWAVEFSLGGTSRSGYSRPLANQAFDRACSPWLDGWMSPSFELPVSGVAICCWIPADGSDSIFTRAKVDFEDVIDTVYMPCCSEMPLISMICRYGQKSITILTLREIARESDWSNILEIATHETQSNMNRAVYFDDVRLCLVGYDSLRSYGHIQLVDLHAGCSVPVERITGMYLERFPVRVDQNVVELWSSEYGRPSMLYDRRASDVIKLSTGCQILGSGGDNVFNCTNVDETLGACVCSSYVDRLDTRSTCYIYDRCASAHCTEYDAPSTTRGLGGMFLRHSEPLNRCLQLESDLTCSAERNVRQSWTLRQLRHQRCEMMHRCYSTC